jgi:ketosteroid isomerase-like protein
MSQENKQIIENINKAFAEGRTDDLLEHWAEDVVWVMRGDST